MKKPKWVVQVAILTCVLLMSAACARDSGGEDAGGGGGGTECPDSEFGCVEVGADDPIKVGTLLVITGPNSALGLDSQYGVEIAAQMRPDVAGHPVELTNEDEGCAAEGGQTGAQSLVSDPQIVAVIGTSCSSAGVPAAEITSEKGVLMVSPSNTAPDLTDPATHQPFYARTAHNDLVQGAAMAQFAAEEIKAKTAATIHDGSPYADGLQTVFSEKFESEYGGTITTQEAVQVGDKDFKPVLTSIAAEEPDYLYYPVFVPEGAGITQQAQQTAGLADTDLAGSDGMLSEDFVDAAGKDAAIGMFLSGPDLQYKGSFYQEKFLPAYKKEFGNPPSVFHAHAFDATNMLFDAIEEVAVETDDGGLLIPRTQLRDAFFDTSDYKGIIGTLTCDENGDCNPTTTIAVNEVTPAGAFKPTFTVTLDLEEAK
ncbi:MAG: branched-chain amino acid ABC transporter substrate-binding protein [Actinomycetota bacterium]|nr:branched-chain amino acid ABC transporter substrate-binding protein [Actinomycetota bacterium]